MIRLDLSASEATILHRVLSSYLDDLKSEIARTDLEGFNDLLLEEQEFIEGLARRLEITDLASQGGADYVG